MITLGIASEHCSSAALMIDGRVVGAIQEERLTKRKNQVAFPARAIDRLVQSHLGGHADKIDRVVYGGKESNPYYTALDRFSAFSVRDHVLEQHELWYPYFYEGKKNAEEYWKGKILAEEHLNFESNFDLSWILSLDTGEATKYFVEHERPQAVARVSGISAPVEAIDHHTCHAAYALWGGELSADQRRRALVLTADGWGDGINWSVSAVDGDGRLERLASGSRHFVARIYKWATLILGMKPNEHEYKVMGLSGYSTSRKHIAEVEEVFFQALDFRNGEFVSEKPLIDSYFDLKQRLEGFRFDNIAAALQNWSSKLTADWAQHWLKQTGRDVLCFSGGLSMNIKANADLLALPEVSYLSVPASGGDESLSIGACFAAEMANGATPEPLRHVYIGDQPEAGGATWTDRLDEEAIDRGDFEVVADIGNDEIARLLAADVVVARCCGPSEFGARALGNRSILANPSNPGNIKIINDSIKNRDFWMPFTPSILAEYANDYLENEKSCASPYMTIGYPSNKERRSDLSAALHPGDFSARPQFVSQLHNPDYWGLIDAFRRITGVPALLNTSLNLHGEPMNYTIADAARTVALSELDFLQLPGNRLLVKKRALDRFRQLVQQ